MEVNCSLEMTHFYLIYFRSQLLLIINFRPCFFFQGGLENMEIAKTYFGQAFKLNPKNVRALFGLQLVSIYVIRKSFSFFAVCLISSYCR